MISTYCHLLQYYLALNNCDFRSHPQFCLSSFSSDRPYFSTLPPNLYRSSTHAHLVSLVLPMATCPVKTRRHAGSRVAPCPPPPREKLNVILQNSDGNSPMSVADENSILHCTVL